MMTKTLVETSIKIFKMLFGVTALLSFIKILGGSRNSYYLKRGFFRLFEFPPVISLT